MFQYTLNLFPSHSNPFMWAGNPADDFTFLQKLFPPLTHCPNCKCRAAPHAFLVIVSHHLGLEAHSFGRLP